MLKYFALILLSFSSFAQESTDRCFGYNSFKISGDVLYEFYYGDWVANEDLVLTKKTSQCLFFENQKKKLKKKDIESATVCSLGSGVKKWQLSYMTKKDSGVLREEDCPKTF